MTNTSTPDTKLGMLENLPLAIAQLGQTIRKRNALTISAFARGKDLANECKPLMEKETEYTIMIVAAEQTVKHQAIINKYQDRVAGYAAQLEAIIAANK